MITFGRQKFSRKNSLLQYCTDARKASLTVVFGRGVVKIIKEDVSNSEADLEGTREPPGFLGEVWLII